MISTASDTAPGRRNSPTLSRRPHSVLIIGAGPGGLAASLLLARAGLMHRLAALPTGIGQGLYIALNYEAGEVWSPDRGAILRQDGTLGLVAATPLGVVTFGGSEGDAGHRKIFFTIGRWF